MMVDWLVPTCLFWVLAAVYLGGMRIAIVGGGGLRQLLGLFAMFALYLVAWWVLRLVLGGLGPVLGAVVLPTLLSVLTIPLVARAGFLALGVKVRKAEPAHH